MRCPRRESSPRWHGACRPRTCPDPDCTLPPLDVHALALFISLAVVVVQTSLIMVERRAKKRMVFVMNKLMWLACLFISVAFIALTYVVVGHDDWWLAWCTMGIGAAIMLTTLGSMCYCIVAHRLEEKNTRKIRRASASQSRGSWSRSVDSDKEILNSEYKTKMYAL